MTACAELAALLPLAACVAQAPELLDPDEDAALAAHLAGCGACRARRDAFAGAAAALAAPDDEAPGVLEAWGGVLARLEDAAAGEPLEDGDAGEGPDEEPVARPRAGPLVIALACTFCHDALRRSEAAYCASCLAPHHEDCLRAHGRCAAPGCEETRLVRPVTFPADGAAGAPAARGWRPVAAVALGALLVAGGAAALRWRVALEHERAALDEVARSREREREREHSAFEGGAALGSAEVVVAPPVRDAPEAGIPEAFALAARVEALLGGEAPAPDRLAALEAARARAAELEALERELERALERAPATPWLHVQRGRVRARLGDHAAAIAAYGRALALDPARADALEARSESYATLGRTAEARADLLRGLTLAAPAAPVAPAEAETAAGPRLVQTTVVGVEGGWALVRRGPDADLRAGDRLAVWGGPQRVAARLTVRELLVGAARCSVEPLVQDAVVRPNDAAVLVSDPAHWARIARIARADDYARVVDHGRPARGIRVLCADSLGGKDARATWSALMASRALDVRAWLGSEPESMQALLAGPSPSPSPLDLAAVDVLVLGEAPEGLVERAALERLLARGGGLVLIAGVQGVAPRSVPPPMLATSVGGVRGPSADRLRLRGALGHLAAALDASPGEVPLPPLEELTDATPAPGSLVLADDAGGRPLVVTRRHGAGHVVQVLARDTSRWQRVAGGDAFLRAFWLEVVAVAAGRASESAPEEPRPGSTR